MKTTLVGAIIEAMTDYIDNDGTLRPHNPAIMRDGDGYRYGSALVPHDGIVWDLEEGMGNSAPTSRDDIGAAAEAMADLIEDELRRG